MSQFWLGESRGEVFNCDSLQTVVTVFFTDDEIYGAMEGHKDDGLTGRYIPYEL